MKTLRAAWLAVLATCPASMASATNLDLGTFYRMRALSYSNLNLGDPRNNHSFISQNAELSAFVRDIHVPLGDFPEQTLDVGLALRAVGIAGSTTAVQAPFDRAAANYPNAQFIPFIESAYVKLKQMFGKPIEATFGQQPFALGSGLLLSDDGAGMAGVSVLGGLPFWGMKAGSFIFQPRNQQGSPNSLMVYGASLELPTEGVWQLNYMMEKDQSAQTSGGGLPITDATRRFMSLRYQMSWGPFIFDGEGAIERGYGDPAPSLLNPQNSRVHFNGNAEVFKAKWRQPISNKWGEGIGRAVFARGSGNKGGPNPTDGAFLPSHGHRFDGLERGGFGDFFGATPYDALGTQPTANGLPAGVSGIQTVGLGFTPPAYHGVALDLDYFLFQADQNNFGPDRTLGNEYDGHLRYGYRDRFQILAGIALFKSGKAINQSRPSAHRYTFEVLGRF